ncbi:MAG: diguanylate cyclase [Nitrospirota bacterium]
MSDQKAQSTAGTMEHEVFFDTALLQWFETVAEQGIFTTDSELRIRHWNPWLENCTGYHASAMAGRSLFEAYPDLISRNMEEYFRRALNGEVSILSQRFHDYLLPVAVPSADSSPVFMQQSVKIAPLFDKKSEVVGTITIIQDVTERVEREKALIREIEVNRAIAELSGMLLSPVTIDDISSIVIKFAKELTCSRFGFIGYMDPVTGDLTSSSQGDDAWCLCLGRDKNEVLNEFYDLWGWVMENRMPVIMNKSSDDPRTGRRSDSFVEACHFLASPARIGNELAGQIAVADPSRNYTDQDLLLVQRLADLYAIAIHRTRMEEELRELSLVDELTGLYNRRGFETLAKQQLKTADRMKKGLFLIFGDLDDLKKINDTYGHKAGDLALVDASDLLRDAFRDSDIIARIGGDEFVILGMESTRIKSSIFLQRLDRQFTHFNDREVRPYRLSMSLGIAEYDPENPCSCDELVSRADAVMYDGKKKKKGNSQELQ